MKISILTPSFNQGQFIKKNIESVLNQHWDDFEHIIIDGASKDNTISILKKYPHLKWISEPDEGQADALNKGLKMATGDIIGWINSDDYYQNDIFYNVISHFKNSKINWIIGDITFVYLAQNIEIFHKSPEITYEKLLENPDILRQQGVFFRKKILDEVGGLNKNFHMVMDYDLWVRTAKKYTPKMVHRNYAYFLWHGDQKSSSKNTIIQAREINTVLKENKISFRHRLRVWSGKYIGFAKSTIKEVLIYFGVVNKKFSNVPRSIFRITK